MPRFRKKPVEIEAVQWDGGNVDEVNTLMSWPRNFSHRDGRLVIYTLEGDMTARPGDWVIRGVQGELYPCKPDIFAATYEPADELDSLTGRPGCTRPSRSPSLLRSSSPSGKAINGLTQPRIQTIDVIPILSAEQLEACWLDGLKVLAPDDSVWRASTYCGGPGFWQSHVHGLWWQDLWERYGNTLRILGPSLRYRHG